MDLKSLGVNPQAVLEEVDGEMNLLVVVPRVDGVMNPSVNPVDGVHLEEILAVGEVRNRCKGFTPTAPVGMTLPTLVEVVWILPDGDHQNLIWPSLIQVKKPSGAANSFGCSAIWDIARTMWSIVSEPVTFDWKMRWRC